MMSFGLSSLPEEALVVESAPGLPVLGAKAKCGSGFPIEARTGAGAVGNLPDADPGELVWTACGVGTDESEAERASTGNG